MTASVLRIIAAKDAGESVIIYGDYDVDGTTSTVLLYAFLRDQGVNVSYYIPNRNDEGYGIPNEVLHEAAADGVSLFITLDCGIKANPQVALARELGLDFLVIDHHLPGEHLPDATAIIDHQLSDCPYPYKELSACGLAFKLVQALAHALRIKREDILSYLDLVALSIASDLVPVTGENRVLARLGLHQLNHNPRPGLRALILECGFHPNHDGNFSLTLANLVFGVGPRLNAAGRVGEARLAAQLLLAKTEAEGKELAKEINEQNNERKGIDNITTKEALELAEAEGTTTGNSCTVVYGENWNKGVIGIVAARCVEAYRQPAIVLTDANDDLCGSARTVNGFDIYQALEACSDLLVDFGGHRFAAGLSLKRENYPAFKQRMQSICEASYSSTGGEDNLEADLEICLKDVTLSLARAINGLSPFGPGNLQPLFVSKQVYGCKETRPIPPKNDNGKHLRIMVYQQDGNLVEAIGYGMGHLKKEIGTDRCFSICYTVELKMNGGREQPMIIIKDISFDDECISKTISEDQADTHLV